MKKRMTCLLTALAVLFGLTGCSGKNGEEKAAVETLPPAAVAWKAPDGDSVIRQNTEYTLWIPLRDEQKLSARAAALEKAGLKETAGMLIQKLLAEINGSGAVRADRKLEMSRDMDVEISRGICTVNLASSALQLSYSDYYRLCLSISSTLCEMEEIQYVNVLTAGQSVPMDPAGRLPMGTLTGHQDENLSVMWEQMEAKRTPQGGDPNRTPLSAQATVYYPLPEGQGIACESRRISFEGQTTGALSSALVDAISETVLSRTAEDNVPDLWEYMVHEPVASEMEEGGRLITLSFREDFPELAERWRTDIACIAAAVTMTLTTFVPGTAAVCIRIGDVPLTELSNRRFRMETILGGLLRRNAFGLFLTGSTEVYFEKDGRLLPTEKAVDRDTADSPRIQLSALMQGPDSAEERQGLHSTLPENAKEDDLLGISAEEDTLLVNFSGRFRDLIEKHGPEKERLVCYAIVNTLCRNTGMKKVCFFFEGEQAETIAGEIYWAGVFFYNPEV